MTTAPQTAADNAALFTLGMLFGFCTSISSSLMGSGNYPAAFLLGTLAFQTVAMMQRYLAFFEEEPTPQLPTVGVKRF